MVGLEPLVDPGGGAGEQVVARGEQLTLPDEFTPGERDRLVTAAVERVVTDGR
ncbi:hypothetical protein ACPCSQ_32545 [Streptomyces griseoincarnatus]